MTALPPVNADDMIDIVKHLPLEIRRTNDLLRVLDSAWVRQRSQLQRAQESYLKDLHVRVSRLPRDGSIDLRKATEDPAAYAQIQAMKDSLLQYSEEKCSTAQQAYDSVATALEKLSVDLRRFEAELKTNGDWKEEVSGRLGCSGPLAVSTSPSLSLSHTLTLLNYPPSSSNPTMQRWTVRGKTMPRAAASSSTPSSSTSRSTTSSTCSSSTNCSCNYSSNSSSSSSNNSNSSSSSTSRLAP